MARRHRKGFTLVEVLIVVVIMAVLAATIIPQFSQSTDDAKVSALQFDLHTLRNQIELYRVQHNGEYPTITSSSLPQLTSKTNAAGTIGTSAAFPYGPYMMTGIPANPFVDDPVKAVQVAQAGTVPPTAAEGTVGWLYDAATGQIWANTDDYIDE
jgi:type II secretion system protein G